MKTLVHSLSYPYRYTRPRFDQKGANGLGLGLVLGSDVAFMASGI